jgi:hypothetical protein
MLDTTHPVRYFKMGYVLRLEPLPSSGVGGRGGYNSAGSIGNSRSLDKEGCSKQQNLYDALKFLRCLLIETTSF